MYVFLAMELARALCRCIWRCALGGKVVLDSLFTDGAKQPTAA